MIARLDLLAGVACALLACAWPAVAAGRDNEADLRTCRARQIELAPKVEDYRGGARIKRLMEADLRRASREEMEGDGDECLEALDHAAKLLAGEY